MSEEQGQPQDQQQIQQEAQTQEPTGQPDPSGFGDISYDQLPDSEKQVWIDRATAVGWVPKEEFRGNPERHTDPRAYVNRAKDNMPLLKANNEKLYEANDQLRKDLEELKESTKAILNYNKQQVEKANNEAVKAYEKAKADIVAEQRRAVEDGDLEKYDALESQKQNIKPPEIKKEDNPPEQQNQQSSASETEDFKKFVENNEWYKTDKKMAAYADAIGEDLINSGTVKSAEQLYQEVARQIRIDMPHKFQNPERDKPPMFAETGSNHAQGGNSGISSLPPEARAAFQKQVEAGIFKPNEIEEYIKIYNS